MIDKIQKIEDILTKSGYKITLGRHEIIKIFVNNKKRHWKPNDIYSLVKGKVSFPTVYRTLDILKKTGIIKEIIIDQDKYYELKIFSQKCLHVHCKCQKCGKIFDFSDVNIAVELLDIKDKVEKKYDIIVYEISTIFEGVCKECRR